MNRKSTSQLIKGIITIIFSAAICTNIFAQTHQKFSITGQLSDKTGNQPVAFATIALKRIADSMLITGVASDQEGKFRLEQVEKGKYNLQISAIGYECIESYIDLRENLEAGTFLLREKSVSLPDVFVSAERKKAESGADKTTWLVNQKMSDAAATGTDLLGYIPGVSVDMMKNISVAGNQNILILVDGREREKNFINQLDASRIDKVEIISTPGSEYDASVTGVINIILKKDRNSGMNGYINAEIPTSASEIYPFPSSSIGYGRGKMNLFASWNGELAYFDILESTSRSFRSIKGPVDILSEQVLRQKNWSHRFHYGFDYYLNEKNQFNFYAWYNPWSRELDGTTILKIREDSIETNLASGTKEDTDSNKAAFYSAYFRHNFSRQGSKIEFDLSNYHYKGESVTEFNLGSDDQVINRSAGVMPKQNSVILRIDYTTLISEKLRLSAGIKTRFQTLQDRQTEEFRYNENVYAAYGALTYDVSKFTFKTGLRAERSSAYLNGSFKSNIISFLPDATISYKLRTTKDLRLAYNRTIKRPGLYELNPNPSYSDLFSSRIGNPCLKPDFLTELTLRYSASAGNTFNSFQVYYRQRNNAINSYTFINEKGIFETSEANLGNIWAYGFELTSGVKLFKIISLNSYLSLYDLHTSANSTAAFYNIENRKKVSFESGISAIATFRHDISASIKFHYSTPGTDLQTITFGDALYFVSLEKIFVKKYKVAITSALPFARSFTYQGSKINGPDFIICNKGNIRLSRIPLWLTFRYQFSSGKKIDRIDRTKEEISNLPQKGF
ncbi:MAG: TonB-dependent receptor domain-containing protein [Methanosarcina sp.]